ncbi:MAG: hypothetical protein M1820_008195 [Bogoriella megaspora]|nr:MAG: hypothetical protein M1820_008195 [Bogoriella megaspora]
MHLICGDLVRSLWFFIFAWVNIAIGPVETNWKFCQVTGFFVQTGIEMGGQHNDETQYVVSSSPHSDLSVLFMSLHTALMVFKPWTRVVGDEGLYSFRHATMAITIGIPLVLASIAFANHGYGYSAQLPICALPVRPFWYRLALQWVPRYIILLTILGLAIAVYHYVEGEFSIFSTNAVSASTDLDSMSAPATASQNLPKVHQSPAGGEFPTQENPTVSRNASTWPPSRRRSSPFSSLTLEVLEEEIAPDEAAPGPITRNPQVSFAKPETQDVAASLFKSIEFKDFGLQKESRSSKRNSSTSTTSTLNNTQNPRLMDESPSKPMIQPPAVVIQEPDGRRASASSQSSATQNPKVQKLGASDPVARRRAKIIRQLRHLFMYPVLYLILWSVPFVLHCYQYSNYYAMRPPFTLVLLAYLSLSITGAVNGLVFNLKERPWRHIPGVDGTLLGSFCFWKVARDDLMPRARRMSSIPGNAFHDSQPPPSQIESRKRSIFLSSSATKSTERDSSEAERCPFVPNQPRPSQNSLTLVPELQPLPQVDPRQIVVPKRQQKRSEAEKRRATQAFTRLAAEKADRQREQSFAGGRRGSLWSGPVSNWFDRRESGLSVDEHEEVGSAMQDTSIRSTRRASERRDSRATF